MFRRMSLTRWTTRKRVPGLFSTSAERTFDGPQKTAISFEVP